MNNNENKTSNEALADEEMDGVAGGYGGSEFKKNNCESCGHFYADDCPQGGSFHYLLNATSATSMTCPSKTAL